MADLDTIFQPEEFRTSGATPEWIFLPNLRLLIGWGNGLWETLGERMSAARTVVAAIFPLPSLEEMYMFFRWIEAHDASRPPMPFYAISLNSDQRCRRLHANPICHAFMGPADHPLHDPACPHPLEANADFRLVHAGVGDMGSRHAVITIERRSKRLKPELQAKMAELGLVHTRGTGKRTESKQPGEKRKRGQRTPFEQAFADHMSAMKREYVDPRIDQLLKDEMHRPRHFLVEAAKQERLRAQLVAQGINDASGNVHKPFTEEELLSATARAIAETEATELAFEYTWAPALQFKIEAGGYVQI